MSWCSECGQCGEADGGIGCQCGKCRCGITADESGYCFLCRPCKMHNRSMQMHTGTMLDECRSERVGKGLLKWKSLAKKETQ
jgi:hypothetical protein